MIRAKDFETLADELGNLGLPFKEVIAQEKIDTNSREINFNVLDASGSENVIYRFSIVKEDNGDYVIDNYQAKMLIVPIEHGLYAGVDTGELDKQMQEIKWAVFPLYKNEPLINFFDKLDQLRNCGEPNAKEIGNKLMIKYFSNTPLEEILPMPDKTPYEKTVVVPIYNNGNDVDIEQAARLLKGESVIKYLNPNSDNGDLCWLRAHNGKIVFFPDFDLAEVIKQMPFVKQPDIMELSEILTDLGNGKSYSTSLLINKRVIEGDIHVRPQSGTLEFRDKTRKTVNWKIWANNKQNKRPGRGKKGPGL